MRSAGPGPRSRSCWDSCSGLSPPGRAHACSCNGGSLSHNQSWPSRQSQFASGFRNILQNKNMYYSVTPPHFPSTCPAPVRPGDWSPACSWSPGCCGSDCNASRIQARLWKQKSQCGFLIWPRLLIPWHRIQIVLVVFVSIVEVVPWLKVGALIGGTLKWFSLRIVSKTFFFFWT